MEFSPDGLAARMSQYFAQPIVKWIGFSKSAIDPIQTEECVEWSRLQGTIAAR